MVSEVGLLYIECEYSTQTELNALRTSRLQSERYQSQNGEYDARHQ